MFAFEIEFNDGISPVEHLLVRRPFVRVGTSDTAHVLIDDLANLGFEIEIIRSIGREFVCRPVATSEIHNSALFKTTEGNFNGYAEFKLDGIKLKVTSLDIDLQYKKDDTADKSVIRVLRNALSKPNPILPAVIVDFNDEKIIQSFSIDQGLLVGQSRKCDLRIESSLIGQEHLFFDYENGKIFVDKADPSLSLKINNEEITAKTYVDYNDVINLPDNIALHIAYTSQHLERFTGVKSENLRKNTIKSPNITYPCLISVNENINPRLIQLIDPTEFKVGRDPICHIWVNSPHISREHARINWLEEKILSVTDLSSNGTFIFDKRLPKEEEVFLENQFIIIDFGNEFRIAFCHNEQERQAFTENQVEEYIKQIDSEYLNQKLFSTYSELSREKSNLSLNDFSISDEKFEENYIQNASDLLIKEDTQEFESFVDRDDVGSSQSFFEEEVLEIQEKPEETTYEMTKVLKAVKEENFSQGNSVNKSNNESLKEVDEEIRENKIVDESELLNEEVFEEGSHAVQKWILIFLITFLLVFCLLLVYGFLSDNYLY